MTPRPDPAHDPALQDPRHTIKHLPNGLTLVTIGRPQARSALITAAIRAGVRFEAPHQCGLSHFLEHMVFQGSGPLPQANAVNEAAEGIGGSVDASTGRDTTWFEHLVHPACLDRGLELMADLLIRPRFADLDAERAIILEEALDEVDDRGRLIDAETWSRLDLWPDDPLGQRIIGDPERIEAFDRADLEGLHRRHYTGPNTVVTVVTPGDLELAADQAARAFSEMPTGPLIEPVCPQKPVNGPRLRLVNDATSQVDCRLVFRGPGAADPDSVVVALIRVILDDGLASRMHARLGTELGLAYQLWASHERYPDTSAFELGAEVSPAKVPTFVKEAQALLQGLVHRPPEAEELARARFRARWAITSGLDHAEVLATNLGGRRLYEAHPESPARLVARVEAITAEDIARVARRLFQPSHYAVCLSGSLARPAQRTVKKLVEGFSLD